MMRLLGLALGAALLMSATGPAAAQGVPSAVIVDPAPDKAHPARAAQVVIPGPDGAEMNALFYLAAGAGPHPTMVLLHGLPGNEQNLDLAQAVRRAGWNVLTLHYRGSWGSQGQFSIAASMQDAMAAMAFVRRPDVAAKYGLDTRKLVIAGHSMGGLDAAAVARSDAGLAGVVLIEAWNAGLSGKSVAGKPDARAAAVASLDDLGHALAGATADSLIAEIETNRDAWDVSNWTADLAGRRLLVIDADRGNAAENKPWIDAIRARPGSRITAMVMPTDHGFSDHRIALAAAVVTWLQALP